MGRPNEKGKMSKLKKAVKRVSAVAVSAAMLTSSALAGSLADYPNNFVKDGKFIGKVVIGADGPADQAAAAMLISDLKAKFSGDVKQYKIVAEKYTGGDGEKVLIADAGKELNYGESLGDVKTSEFDDSDSDLLAKGTLKLATTEDYEQSLELANNGIFEHSLRDDLGNEISDHIYFEKGPIITYKLELDSDMDMSDVTDDDIVGKTITIMGNEFTIGDDWSKDASGKGLDKLKLIGGGTKVSLGEGDSTTVNVNGESYEITVQSVSDNKVLLTVNGETMSIDEYDSEDVGGVSIAVTDLVPSSRDAVKGYAEFVVGGQEILLEDGQEVKINDEKISDLYDDYKVVAHFQNSASGWEGFNLTYEWENSDGFMLKAGDSFDDKVFKAFSIVYEGNNVDFDSDYSEVKVESAGDKLKVSGKTIGGDDFSEEIAYVLDNDNANTPVRLIGGDRDAPFLVNGFDASSVNVYASSGNLANNNASTADYFNASSTTKYYYLSDGTNIYYVGTGAEIANLIDADYTPTGNTVNGIKATASDNGLRFLTGDTDNQYIYEITGYDEVDDEFDFKNILTGSTKSDVKYDEVSGKLDDLTFVANGTTDLITKIENTKSNDKIAFENELLMDLSDMNKLDVDNAKISVSYDADDLNEDDTGDASGFTIDFGTYDTSDGEFTLTVNSGDYVSFNGADQDVAADDDNVKEYVNKYGTLVRYDADNKEWVDIYTPKEEVEAKVYVVFGDVGSKEVKTYTVSADDLDSKKQELIDEGYEITDVEEVSSGDVEFDVSDPVLDTEVTSTEDLIVVGGPAVNRIAAKLLGLSYPTYGVASGVNPGEGIIRYYDDVNSILVYGWEAEDTRKAVEALIAGGLEGDEERV